MQISDAAEGPADCHSNSTLRGGQGIPGRADAERDALAHCHGDSVWIGDSARSWRSDGIDGGAAAGQTDIAVRRGRRSGKKDDEITHSRTVRQRRPESCNCHRHGRQFPVDLLVITLCGPGSPLARGTKMHGAAKNVPYQDRCVSHSTQGPILAWYCQRVDSSCSSVLRAISAATACARSRRRWSQCTASVRHLRCKNALNVLQTTGGTERIGEPNTRLKHPDGHANG